MLRPAAHSLLADRDARGVAAPSSRGRTVRAAGATTCHVVAFQP
ncbi:MAG: hypothetical protein ACE5JG_04140 [Planctomycetota bacterium]